MIGIKWRTLVSKTFTTYDGGRMNNAASNVCTFAAS
jgi:hypothetical protein